MGLAIFTAVSIGLVAYLGYLLVAGWRGARTFAAGSERRFVCTGRLGRRGSGTSVPQIVLEVQDDGLHVYLAERLLKGPTILPKATCDVQVGSSKWGTLFIERNRGMRLSYRQADGERLFRVLRSSGWSFDTMLP